MSELVLSHLTSLCTLSNFGSLLLNYALDRSPKNVSLRALALPPLELGLLMDMPPRAV